MIKAKEAIDKIGGIFDIVSNGAKVIGKLWIIIGGVPIILRSFKELIEKMIGTDGIFLAMLICFMLTVLFIILFCLNCKRKLYIQNTENDHRKEAIIKLDKNAKKSIHIMGIGLSNVADSLDDIGKALEKNDMHIIILAIDGKIAKEWGKNTNDYIKETYKIDLQTLDEQNSNKRDEQIAKINDFINTRKIERKHREANGGSLKGKIELRKYSSFLPINITIADMVNERSKMIVEYIMPFDENKNRICLEINTNDYNSKELKKVAINTKEIIKNLLEESKSNVTADY